MPKDVEHVAKVIDSHSDKEFVYHLRFATEGDKDKGNCHPFRITTKEKHGLDTVLFHNGTLRFMDIQNTGRSDTWHFVKYFLRPILQKNPELGFDKDFIDTMSNIIGVSKFLLMDETGRIAKYNAKDWDTRDMGVHLSNSYTFPKEEPKKTQLQLAPPSPRPGTIGFGRKVKDLTAYGIEDDIYGEHWSYGMNGFQHPGTAASATYVEDPLAGYELAYPIAASDVEITLKNGFAFDGYTIEQLITEDFESLVAHCVETPGAVASFIAWMVYQGNSKDSVVPADQYHLLADGDFYNDHTSGNLKDKKGE